MGSLVEKTPWRPGRRTIPYRMQGVPEFVLSQVLSWIDKGLFPGCVLGYWRHHRWQWRLRAGWAVVKPEIIPMRWGTLFDVASLTKPLVTARAVLENFTESEILENPLRDVDPAYLGLWSNVSLLDLLEHRAGFLDWAPLYLMTSDNDERFQRLTQDPELRPGRFGNTQYSCLDYQWLGLWLKRQGVHLQDFTSKFQRQKHGAISGFNPPKEIQRHVAGTETYRHYEKKLAESRGYDVHNFRWDRRFNWGKVHDLNAYTLHRGEAAGNAGLFANIEGLLSLSRPWLSSDGRLAQVIREHVNSPGNYTLGWRQGFPELDETQGECLYHSGFTGVCVVLSLRQRAAWFFLTNRIHPQVPGTSIQPIRRQMFMYAIG